MDFGACRNGNGAASLNRFTLLDGCLALREAPRLLNGFTNSVDVEKLERRSEVAPASDFDRHITALIQTTIEIILTDTLVILCIPEPLKCSLIFEVIL
jgi:hypothetical protein